MNKDSKLLFESYELIVERQQYVNILLKEGYTYEQINSIIQTEGWEGVKKFARRFAPAALGAMSLANSAMAADNNAINYNDPNQYRDNRPAAVEVQTQQQMSPEQRAFQDKIVSTIRNSDTGFSITKEALIKATSSAEDAEKFLSAMTPKQSQTRFNVYGWNAATKAFAPNYLNKMLSGAEGAWAITVHPTGNSNNLSIIFKEKSSELSDREIINNIRHEVQHASDDTQYSRSSPDYDNKTQEDTSWGGSLALHRDVPVASLKANSLNKGAAKRFISPDEIRGRIAGSRSYLGVVSTPEQFKQKWDEACKLYDQAKNPQEWFKDNVKFNIPENFKQLIYIYKSDMASSQDQQKLYNYIQRTALDNSVAKNADTSSQGIA